MRESSVEATSPAISEIAALKDRIEEDDSGSDNDGCGGQEHGTEARRARVHQPLPPGACLAHGATR
jgi:hypothetical protein